MKLRVLVLGGTRFIGRRIVDELLDGGHDVVVVHRGQTEPPDLPDVPHLHANRLALDEVTDGIGAFGPDVVIDCAAIGAADADAVIAAFPGDGVRLVVLSSMDTYRAYAGLHRNTPTDAVPVDETSPVRTGDQRYPYRGQIPGGAGVPGWGGCNGAVREARRGRAVARTRWHRLATADDVRRARLPAARGVHLAPGARRADADPDRRGERPSRAWVRRRCRTRRAARRRSAGRRRRR